MRNLKLSALLASVGVLALTAVGSSAPNKTAVVKMMDFDRKTSVLVGYAGTEINPGYYKRLENTAHLPGIGGPNYPPNPCKAHISVYNKILQSVPPGPGRLNATLSVLSNMARSNCTVVVEYDGAADPTQADAALFTLQPRADL
jgi:hypothetical protein